MPSSQMKIADVPPWRAYVCIAFLTENTEGALRRVGSASRDEGMVLHRLDETLLVDWHLDRDVWEILVNFWVWVWLYCGIVHRVFVVLGNWTEDEANVAYELEGKELCCKICYEYEEGEGRTYDRDAEYDGEGGAESKPSWIAVKGIFFEKNRYSGQCKI